MQINKDTVRFSNFGDGFRYSASCRLLYRITPENLSKLPKSSNGGVSFSDEFPFVDGLFLDGLASYEFLALEYPNLRFLSIAAWDDASISPIEKLSNLRGLSIVGKVSSLDFQAFSKLEKLSIDCGKFPVSLSGCRDLIGLSISNFSGKNRNLFELRNLKNLDTLVVRESSIDSLDGIESLEDLRKLDITSCKNLRDISAFEKSQLQIRDLDLYGISKCSDFSPIQNLSRLKKLVMSKFQKLETIVWMRELKHLEFLSLDVSIEDGHIEWVAKDLPRLRFFYANQQKNFDAKVKEISEILKARLEAENLEYPN